MFWLIIRDKFILESLLSELISYAKDSLKTKDTILKPFLPFQT